MGKAEPCRFCKTDQALRFRTWNQQEWWVCCDGCGQIGFVKPTRSEAGESWNQKQKAKKESPAASKEGGR